MPSGTANNQQWGSAMRRRLHLRQIKFWLANGPDRGDHHGSMVGDTSSHDRRRCDLFYSRRAEQRSHFPEDQVRFVAGRENHPRHPIRGRDDDRQAVGTAQVV